MTSILAFAKRPVGGLIVIALALITLCFCGGSVMGQLLPDDSTPTPSKSTKASASASTSASPSTSPSPTPEAVAPALPPPPPTTKAAAPTTKAAPKPTKTSSAPKPACHPNYSVCLPITDDIDCGEISQRNFFVVGGQDPYRLDSDNDGIACEQN